MPKEKTTLPNLAHAEEHKECKNSYCKRDKHFNKLSIFPLQSCKYTSKVKQRVYQWKCDSHKFTIQFILKTELTQTNS